MEIASRDLEFNIWYYEVEGWLEQSLAEPSKRRGEKGGAERKSVGGVKGWVSHPSTPRPTVFPPLSFVVARRGLVCAGQRPLCLPRCFYLFASQEGTQACGAMPPMGLRVMNQVMRGSGQSRVREPERIGGGDRWVVGLGAQWGEFGRGSWDPLQICKEGSVGASSRRPSVK